MSLAQLLKPEGWDCSQCGSEIQGSELKRLQSAVQCGEQIAPWYICDDCLGDDGKAWVRRICKAFGIKSRRWQE